MPVNKEKLRSDSDVKFDAWLEANPQSSDQEQESKYREIVIGNLNSSEGSCEPGWFSRLFLKSK